MIDQGYFIVRDALEPAHVAALQGLLQGVHAQKVAEGRFEDEDIWQAVFSRSNDLQLHDEVVRLLTHDRVLPKIVDIMGTNIYCWCSSPRSSRFPSFSCTGSFRPCPFHSSSRFPPPASTASPAELLCG